MSIPKKHLTFNKDMMTVNDLKSAANALEQIFNVFDRNVDAKPAPDSKRLGRDTVYDWTPEGAENIVCALIQLREGFETS